MAKNIVNKRYAFVKMLLVILFLPILILFGCSKNELDKDKVQQLEQAQRIAEQQALNQPSANEAAQESAQALPQGEIELKTDDGVKIRGTFKDKGEKAVILLHQMNKDRHTYDSFVKELNDAGYSTLAIDLRGHGKSDLDWHTFDKSASEKNDFIKMENDIRAAKKFLDGRGKSTFAIIGASIGANIALIYASHDKSIKTIVLLSPGLDYHNVKISSAAESYTGTALLAAERGDDYSYGTVSALAKKIERRHNEVFYEGDAHGTDMFKGTDLNEKILKWLKENDEQ